MAFTRPEIITDADTLADRAKAKLEEELPGWDRDADPVTSAILDAVADPAAEQAQATELELIEALRGIGEIHGVSPVAAIAAQANATFALSAPAGVGGYVIEAGALIGVRDPNLNLQGFRLIADLEVAEGATSAVGAVEAEEPGSEANNLEGAAVLVDTPPAVASATLSTSGGGEEEEDDASFLDRLVEDLELFKIGVVRASDAAGVARKVAGVGRATAVDLLKPGAADGGEGSEEVLVERAVTVAVTEADGTPTSSTVRTNVLAELNEGAIANMRFFVVSPHYQEMDVAATVYAWPGQELANVKREVEEALERLLDPATAQTGPSGNPSRWANDPVIRQSAIIEAIGSVPSVRWCSAATFGGHGGGLGTADYTLVSTSKVPALPEVGTLTITVNPTT